MREIDVDFQGVPRAICCLEHEGVVIDPGPDSCHERLVEQLAAPPRAILLTHIHLDHAGGAGELAARFPEAEVWVHERGARHIADPSKLVASATRIYGDDMERLWGRIIPVPEERLRVLTGDAGEAAEGWSWAYTPGHAQHHVAYRHDETGLVYAGDVAGIRIGDGPVLPPTPPPDIDLGAWNRSLDLLESWEPSALCATHFGIHRDAAAHIAALREGLTRWGGLARETDDASYAAAVTAEIEAQVADPDLRAAYLRANPPGTLWSGLARYWKLKEEGRL